MAVCRQCNSEMQTPTSCLPDLIPISGRLFAPIRWGAERESRRWVVESPCRDCNTPVGGVHHPGCCLESCPACRGQALGCPASSRSTTAFGDAGIGVAATAFLVHFTAPDGREDLLRR